MMTIRELLPPRARAKYEALLAEIDDCRALLGTLGARYENASRTLIVARAGPRRHRHGRRALRAPAERGRSRRAGARRDHQQRASRRIDTS
jgi:hypothetical protein